MVIFHSYVTNYQRVPSIYPLYVSIYTSTMDPMGLKRSLSLNHIGNIILQAKEGKGILWLLCMACWPNCICLYLFNHPVEMEMRCSSWPSCVTYSNILSTYHISSLYRIWLLYIYDMIYMYISCMIMYHLSLYSMICTYFTMYCHTLKLYHNPPAVEAHASEAPRCDLDKAGCLRTSTDVCRGKGKVLILSGWWFQPSWKILII